MNTRNEVESSNNVAQLAKRARLDGLLFKGSMRPGPGLMPIKWPDRAGE